MKTKESYIIFFIISLLVPAAHANLIVNGNFEWGDSDFTTDYVYDNYLGDQGSYDAGQYCIGTNPKNHHPDAEWYRDHTSGFGKMMIVNGDDLPDKTVWQQTVSVLPGRGYIFSYYLSNWSTPNPAKLRLYINDTEISASDFSASTTGDWEITAYYWNSESNTTATIRLVDMELNIIGNDFALDDICLIRVPWDHAGNYMGAARNIGVLSGCREYNDWVGICDTDDYYKFTLDDSCEHWDFSVLLSDLVADADIYVLNSYGGTVWRGYNIYDGPESWSGTLDPGTYYIWIYPYEDAMTDYTLTVCAAKAAVNLDYDFLASLKFLNDYEYDLYGSSKTGSNIHFPCSNEELDNIEALYLTKAGQTDLIHYNLSQVREIASQLASLTVLPFPSVIFELNHFEKDGSILYTWSDDEGTIDAFSDEDIASRSVKYSRFITDAVTLSDLPLDQIYVEMSDGQNMSYYAPELDSQTLGKFVSAITSLRIAYGLDEDALTDGLPNIGVLNSFADSDIVSLLEQLEEQQTSGEEFSIISALRILKKFKGRHPVLAQKLTAVQDFNTIITMISGSVQEQREDALAEIIIRSYLNGKTDMAAGLNLFSEAYDYAVTTYEPDLDPAIDIAITDTQAALNSEMQIIEQLLYAYLSEPDMEIGVQFLNEMIQNAKTGDNDLMGKISVSAVSAINKSAESELAEYFQDDSEGSNVVSSALEYLNLVENRYEFEPEFSALAGLNTIIRMYRYELTCEKTIDDVWQVDTAVSINRCGEMEEYLALRMCGSILNNYKPEWNLDELIKELAAGFVSAPITEEYEGSIDDITAQVMFKIALWAYDEDFEYIRSRTIKILNSLQDHYDAADQSTLHLKELLWTGQG
jgi:hypothetical protein